ncbi:tannase and feruloyl esterase-domain-containing protein [Aspergillus aurantiobrunneus]
MSSRVLASHALCSKATFTIPNTTVDSAAYYSNGDVIPIPSYRTILRWPNIQNRVTNNICRVVVNATTSASSSVRIEAWLPDTWNNRFLATGTGGEGGCIDYETVQIVINDFGYRSVHVEAEVGKELVTRYYGRKPSKSYYQDCSTGGRQGLQSAQLYPDDFDGIVAGAPGIDWLHIVASKGVLARRIGWPEIDLPAYVRPEQWPAITAKQVEMYDLLDGVEDGIIDNPTQYTFDPEILACGTGLLNSSLCLTAAQVQSVRAAYLPIADSQGHIVYPAFSIGADTAVFSDNQADGRLQLSSYTLLQDFWRGAIYNNSNWTPLNFSLEDMGLALKINPGGVNAADPDFTQFYQKGGKILSYHGRSDETVTSRLSMEYYVSVQAALNLTLDKMQSLYRLFWVPGMHHCSGGPGAWNFGQSYPLDVETLDPTRNVLLALVEWVEGSTAPESLVGTKYEDDDVAKNVTAQRKHCYYPHRSVWDGVGDPKTAESWYCTV